MPTEIYPRAPVRFVSLAVRYPLAPALQRMESKEAVYTELAGSFPLLEAIDQPMLGGFRIGIGGVGLQQGIPGADGPRQIRMTSRERTRSITLGPQMLLFECTDHESFESLRAAVRPALEALQRIASPTALSDLTLKYVDEIRHPSVASTQDWTGLISDTLIGPASLLDEAPAQTSGVVIYQFSPEHQLRVAYGAAPDGFVVDPTGPLRVEDHGSGAFFHLDMESEWKAPPDSVPPFDGEQVVALSEQLHAPIRSTFERVITDRLRDHFRGTDAANG